MTEAQPLKEATNHGEMSDQTRREQDNQREKGEGTIDGGPAQNPHYRKRNKTEPMMRINWRRPNQRNSKAGKTEIVRRPYQAARLISFISINIQWWQGR
jgi:hypothetical protein